MSHLTFSKHLYFFVEMGRWYSEQMLRICSLYHLPISTKYIFVEIRWQGGQLPALPPDLYKRSRGIFCEN